ncbi:MAG: YdcF family protein [Patescibacteria group bacterium]|jgi:uncharacterized SAM-binding protein YcdF (DUF218 family)
MTAAVDVLAKKIWNYHLMHQQLEKADCILVLGCCDERVAEYGARLFLEGWAPLLILSGGLGRHTKKIWDEPEAEKFAHIALQMGVPQEKIIIENKSTNTGENLSFVKKILDEKGLPLKKFLVMQKPYMERRAYATFKKVLPEKEVTVTSPPISFEKYPDALRSKSDVISIMVGDLQRVKLYAETGYQIPQEIPLDVWAAYEELVRLGYTSELTDEAPHLSAKRVN